ncbi:Protein of unknown function [Cotesia congregata]|uniref:Uncharacterized protein n=1 Tax=Cotesia congregata TaxID=51543 RepID=A0A8J2MS88_COTCN|nr:Protein of unknown function [Cotesia congregata]
MPATLKAESELEGDSMETLFDLGLDDLSSNGYINGEGIYKWNTRVGTLQRENHDLILLILVTIIGLGRCLEQVPSKLEIESSINRTIEEVERMIDRDEKLPKLSREQIVDILFNITSQDIDSMEESVRQARSDYQRALLVVLPYNSKDAKNQDIKDLYTKPPMVQIIPDSEGMIPFSSIQEENPVLDNFISSKYVEEINNEFGSMQDSSEEKGESDPERFSLISDDWEIETKQTKNNQVGSGKTDKTTKMMKSTEPEAVTVPATRSTVNVLTSDQWRYYGPPATPKTTTSTTTTTTTTTTQKPTTTTRRPTTSTTTTTQRPTTTTTTTTKSPLIGFSKESHRNWVPFLPTAMSSSLTEEAFSIPPFKKLPTTTTIQPEIITFDMMEMMKDEPQPSLFVTPMSSHSDEKLINSTSLKDSKIEIPMRNEVMTLLKSIGLSGSETKLNANPSAAQGIYATNFEIPESDSIGQMSAMGVDSPTIASQNTFEQTPKDVRQGFNNLAPDVQWLFQRFGMAAMKDLDYQKQTTTSTTTRAPVPVRWNNFKPLPNSEVKDESMREFLAKFGLGTDRGRKSMKDQRVAEKDDQSVIEAVPENMRGILANIGLIERKSLPGKAKPTPRVDSEPKLHVFKPHEIQLSDQRQRIKINQLLDTVRLAQEGKAQVSDVRQAASELLETAKTLKEGPDPLNLQELMQMYNNEARNEVKRQNNSSMSDGTPDAEEDSTTSITTASPTLATSSEATGTEMPKDAELPADSVGVPSDSSSKTTESANIDDLADSFGGTTSEPDPVLPTPKKTGLYFLVDWNSFLEVGEDDKDSKVNLRFAPKAGDRTQFIPVVIP